MTEERGSLRPIFDSLGALLSNPVILEGLIAGISAFSASRRAKENGTQSGGGILSTGGLLDLLPGILPLLSVMTGTGADNTASVSEPPAQVSAPLEDPAADIAAATADVSDGGIVSAAAGGAETGGDDDTAALLFGADNGGDSSAGAFDFTDKTGSGVDVRNESRESQRENLLLAIRPFLSDSRRSAADAMVQVNRLSGLFRQS